MTDTKDLPVTGPPPPLPDGPGSLEWVSRVSANVLRCVNRHFAAASAELARDATAADGGPERFAAASTRFRTLLEWEQGLRERTFDATPYVLADTGRTIPLVSLFIDACHRYHLPLPNRSIDAGLVHEAKALLVGLPWRLPDDPLAARG